MRAKQDPDHLVIWSVWDSDLSNQNKV